VRSSRLRSAGAGRVKRRWRGRARSAAHPAAAAKACAGHGASVHASGRTRSSVGGECDKVAANATTGGSKLKHTGTPPSGAPRRRRLRRWCWPAAGLRAPAHPGAHHCRPRPRPRPPTHLPFQRLLCAPPALAPELDSQRRLGESAGCAALRT
jgi:hypothetical protein